MPTRGWTRYCVVTMILLSTLKIACLLIHPSDNVKAVGGTFVAMLVAVDLVARCMLSIVLQALLIRRRFELAALVECVVSYMSCRGPSLSSSRCMALVLAWFLASSFFLTILGLIAASYVWTAPSLTTVTYIVTELIPTHHTTLVESAMAALLGSCAFLGRDAADDVRDQIGSLASRIRKGMSVEADVVTALELRELRTRQQALHEVVRASNNAQGGAKLCCVFVTVMEAAVSSFIGIAHSNGITTVFWSTAIISKFISCCILGQQLCDNHSRISDTLQGFLVTCSSIPKRKRREVQGFRHQLEMQDCRCGIFDLLYFDFTTMKAVIGTYMTCLVILSQFDYQ
ncbi:uncharacterized protein LOC117650283 [Thrips palmi]|uniref:Gustatory receptor n=1 Tax=Thrips palmi TaxID=161013 RepID=A0A6P8ZVV4_THRPL|nr:uncharacterized protein LOC117650283 [Thrips palmi]